MTFDCSKTQRNGYDTRHDARCVAFTNFTRRDCSCKCPSPPVLYMLSPPSSPSESRHNANHYSKRIMQTRYLIKNIFVLARSLLLRADIYRPISYPVVTQNPQLIALIRRDCAHGDGHIYTCSANEFSISRTSPRQRNLRNRALVNYMPPRARARTVICDMYHATCSKRITNKTQCKINNCYNLLYNVRFICLGQYIN